MLFRSKQSKLAGEYRAFARVLMESSRPESGPDPGNDGADVDQEMLAVA